MSSANLELVRSIVSAWEHGDFSSVGWAHADIDFQVVDGPSPGRWSGTAGMVQGWRDFLGAWDEWSAEADEYREIDDEHVLVRSRFSGRGRSSGLDLERVGATGGAIYQVRDDKLIRIVLYMDYERALVDCGLRAEEDDQR